MEKGMEDLSRLSHSELVDVLNQQTYKYTTMFRQGINETAYIRCKNYIDEIIAEIETRKNSNADTNHSGKE